MKKIQILSISLLFICLVTSCSKSIDLEPISSISNSSFWKTENDAKGVLNGMYVRLRTRVIANNHYLFMGEARSEVMGPNFSTPAPYDLFYDNVLDKNNSGPVTWEGLYATIHDANLLIKFVPEIKFGSNDEKNDILAQAHTMRAFSYFLLVKTWGDVPLRDIPIEGSSEELIQKERTSKSEIFAFIKQDINAATKLFSNNNFPAGRNVWSKPAANALKADIFLWTGKRLNGGNADFEVALSALNEVENADVALLDNYADVFAFNNKGNKEMIFSIKFGEFEAGNGYGTTYLYPSYLPPNIDDATKNAIGVPGGGSQWTVSDLVRNQFTIDDQRRNVTFLEMYTLDNVGNRTFYGSFAYKFKGVVIGGVRNFIDDVPIYRYADILLMKAEAKNALGQNPTTEINLVRRRAYKSNFSSHVFVNGSKENNDEAILKERLFELTVEGKRWWDLVRFGKAFDLVPSLKSRKGQDHLLLFPISETVLGLEPKVKQNPGY